MALYIHTRLPKLLQQGLIIGFQEIRLDGCGNNVVIPLQKLLCLLRRKQLQQALHQPPRVTITNGEVFRRTSLGNGRHIHPVGNEFPQHVSYLNPVQLSTIDQIHQQPEEGFKYTVEGIVTSNASGHDKDTAFFDCIYIQDETGGINCFPVAGDFKIGDRVRVSGTTSSYQGERQLAVTKIEKIGDGTPVTPLTVTSTQVNDGSVLGRLVTLKGIVTAIEMAEGKVQTILVRDSQGKVARVFIDGYICPESEVQNLKVGCAIEATGLASYDNTFVLSDGTAMAPRIRISNRADVICTDHTHAFGAWTVTTPASGAETRKCACGETETRLLPATGHTDANMDGKCDLCGQTLTPATGDTMHLTLWLSLMALTALAGVALTRQKKRRA